MHALDFPLGAATACSAALLQTLDCLSDGAVKYDLLFPKSLSLRKELQMQNVLGRLPS
jgi:hypothetical protein